MTKKGFRNTKQKLRTARGRTTSQQQWLSRHLNDPYVNLAKTEGYRSRAAYKLKEVEEKFGILKKSRVIVDLGCAPGGWLQVAREFAGVRAEIVGIDLLEIESLPNVKFLKGDFLQDEMVEQLEALVKGKVDLVMSDMAANSCGNKEVDHLKNITLVELAFEFTMRHLIDGGNFIAKVFRGGREQKLFDDLRPYFEKTKQFKPKASYATSSEVYFVGIGFKRDKIL